MNYKVIPFLVLATSLLPFRAQAQEEWTLRQCVEHAIKNNLSIRKSELETELSKVEVNTTKWARLPNLSASANQSFNWGGLSPKDNTYTSTKTANSNFGLSTNVPLFTGMQIPNSYALAKLDLKATIEDLNKAKDDMAINVASSYVQVLYNYELSKVAAEQVMLSKQQLNRMVRMREVGKSSSAEVAEARARVAQDEMSAVQADNTYRLSLLDLSQLLELSTPEGFAISSPDIEPEFVPLTPPDEIYLGAVTSKPGIMAAQYRLEGSEKSIRIAQSGYYPTLSLGAEMYSRFYTTNGRAGIDFFSQLDNNLNKSIYFNLSIPIFNRFATRNRVRTARLQKQNYSIRLDEAKKELYKEIQQSWYNALAAETKYNTSKVAVEANEESFRLMSEKFENGKATSVEYNEARLNLMKALSDRIQAKYEYIFRSKVLDFYKGNPIQ